MFGFRNDKESERYYLLPGMGGRNHRRKQFYILTCSVIAAVIVAIILAVLMYWMNRPRA